VDGLYAQIISNFQFPISNESQNKNEIVSLMSAGGRRVYACKLETPNLGVCTDFFVGEIEDFLGEELETPKLGVCTRIIGEVNEEVENWIKSSGFENFELLNERDVKGRAWGAVRVWDELPDVANDNVIPMYLREAVLQEVRNKK